MRRNPRMPPSYSEWRRELDRYGCDPDDLRLPDLCRSEEAFQVEQYAERRLVTTVARPQSRAQELLVAAIGALTLAFVALCLYGLVTVGVP